MPAARASELSVGICSCNFDRARRVIVAPPYGRAPALVIKRRELGRFVQVDCPPSFVEVFASWPLVRTEPAYRALYKDHGK